MIHEENSGVHADASRTRSSSGWSAAGTIFGGEHSGHYYFRDDSPRDSGLIAAVVVLAQVSQASVRCRSCSRRSGDTPRRVESTRR